MFEVSLVMVSSNLCSNFDLGKWTFDLQREFTETYSHAARKKNKILSNYKVAVCTQMNSTKNWCTLQQKESASFCNVLIVSNVK